jgi:translation initiation factor IF-2
VSDEDKQTLLAFLKRSHGESTAAPKRITLKRKTVSTLRAGSSQGRKTVNVEVRKKRTYVKRDVLADGEGADETTEVLEPEVPAVEETPEAAPAEDAVVAEAPCRRPRRRSRRSRRRTRRTSIRRFCASERRRDARRKKRKKRRPAPRRSPRARPRRSARNRKQRPRAPARRVRTRRKRSETPARGARNAGAGSAAQEEHARSTQAGGAARPRQAPRSQPVPVGSRGRRGRRAAPSRWTSQDQGDPRGTRQARIRDAYRQESLRGTDRRHDIRRRTSRSRCPSRRAW